MAIIRYNGVGIRAMSACVPQPVAYNRDLTTIMNEEEVAKMIDSVGIHERRVCPPEVCASDLCFKAAQQLMEENGIAHCLRPLPMRQCRALTVCCCAMERLLPST